MVSGFAMKGPELEVCVDDQQKQTGMSPSAEADAEGSDWPKWGQRDKREL